MKPIANYANASAATEYKRPTAGGYVCRITKATDVPEREYLAIEFDVVEGEFKNYGKDTLERAGWTPFKFNRSYNSKSVGFFKAFIEAVEGTNNGYNWDWNEQALVGKGVGIVLREEQYRKNDGSIGMRLSPAVFKTATDIRCGKFTVPDPKLLEDKPVVFTELPDDGELPF